MGDDWKYAVLVVVVFLLLFISGWTGFSYFEAKSYEEVTGKKVTLRQAMFLPLRVLEPVK